MARREDPAALDSVVLDLQEAREDVTSLGYEERIVLKAAISVAAHERVRRTAQAEEEIREKMRPRRVRPYIPQDALPADKRAARRAQWKLTKQGQRGKSG